MKKLFAILLSALLLATPALAAENFSDQVVEEAAYGTATIDGNIAAGEWDAAKTITITLDDPIVNELGVYQGNWASDRSNAGDFSTEIKLMWDENNLYVYENRVDDDVILDGSASAPWAGSDGNLIFLQAGDSGSAINPDGYSHHIFYIPGNENGAEGGSVMVRICDQSITSQEVVENDSIQIVGKKTATGWMTEIAVPWSVFQEEVPDFAPGADVVMGLSFVPIDNDDDGADFSQLCWFNQADALGAVGGYDYGGWATLKLLAAPVVETPVDPVETPAETTPDAPTTPAAQTADMGIIAALAVLAVASGAVLTIKKSK